MRRFGAWTIVLALVGGLAAWQSNVAPERTAAPMDVAEAEGVITDGVVDAAADVAKGAASELTRYVAPDLRATGVWDLPRTHNARVQRWIDYLTGPNRHRMRLWLEREGRYGGLIRERLRARGMPEDLLYLGMIESGLSPRAYSHAHASGMWQFIAETGRRYGLEVTGFVDERRDPVEATEAALDYLSELHDRFGSWYLAAAGYNSGENRVERILRQRVGGQKGNEALFWMIDEYLPRETRDYVPLMLAAAHIGKNPGKYGFHEVALEAPLEFERVEVPGGVTLRTVAKSAGVEVEAIQELNPHLLRGVTPPGGDWQLRVPVGTRDRVLASVERLAEEARLATVVHLVGRGETLGHIARRYGVEVDVVRATNGHVNPRRLQIGQRLRIPVDGSSASASGEREWTTYRVRPGDNLWEIARRYGVSVRELRSWNGVDSRIYPGQRLRIGA